MHGAIDDQTHGNLDTLDDDSPLAIQFVRISVVALLFAVLQPTAFMIFQHAMLATELALAERAIADNALSLILAILEGTADLLRTATAHGKSDVYCGVCWK